MRVKRKNKLIVLIVSILFISSLWFIYESRYFNKVEFLSPIAFEGNIPIRNDAMGSGEFGAPRKGKRVHAGLDILAEVGMPVNAIRSGRVINAETKRGLGKYVEIRHLGELISIYAHLSKIGVRKGERVYQGQIIGEVGKSGNARHPKIKPHLHFEIRKGGIPQDPKEYLIQ